MLLIRIVSFIKDDWKYKLLALCIAFLLWAYVSSERNPSDELIFNIAVDAINIPVGFNMELSQNQITVVLRGSRSVIEKISPEDINIWVDLKGQDIDKLERGATLPVMSGFNKTKNKRFDIILRPSKLNVKIVQLNNKYLPIDVYYDAPPPVGYHYKERSISHNTVEVSGNAASVERVTKVSANIPIMDSVGFSGKVPLIAYGKNGEELKNIKMFPRFIDVKVELEEEIVRKYVLVDPIVVGSPAYPYKVTSIKVVPNEILIEAPSIALNDLNIIKTDVIPIENSKDTIRTKIKCNIPIGMKGATGDMVEVIINIDREE